MEQNILTDVKDILSFAFTIIGTIVGVLVVIKAHRATLLGVKSAERLEEFRQGLALNEIRMGIHRRLEVLQVKLGNNIHNLRETIEEGAIEGMCNPRSTELWRLMLPIQVYFSEKTFSKYKELVELIKECSKKNGPELLKALGKYDEAHESYMAMVNCFGELMNEYIPSDMRKSISLE